MIYILPIIIIVFSIPWILCAIDKCKGTHLSCKYFGWHNGNLNKKYSFNKSAKCSKCGADVLQDSQGNWFV